MNKYLIEYYYRNEPNFYSYFKEIEAETSEKAIEKLKEENQFIRIRKIDTIDK